MIDDKKEVHELIEVLNEHLPMQAFATPALMKAVRQNGTDIRVNTAVKIDSVLYLGDEGGIACAIELSGGKTGVVASLTHLRFDPEHPLAGRIQAYQSRRSQRLGQAASPGPVKLRAKLAAKVKGKTARVAPDNRPTWSCAVRNSMTPGNHCSRKSASAANINALSSRLLSYWQR